MALIQTSADDIGTVAFDRDTKRNALSAELTAETISARLRRFRAEARLRGQVLRSAPSARCGQPAMTSQN